MLGHALLLHLWKSGMDVHGAVRTSEGLSAWFPPTVVNRLVDGVDAERLESVERILSTMRPDVVINCIGIVKQLPEASDPALSIAVNALFPHRLASLCLSVGARLIHISTDCVFSGSRGMYTEKDVSDADDLYGRTKYLGEISYTHCITLRTSMIGHELKRKTGLVEWFLDKQNSVLGYRKAIFSGFPTCELSRVISDHVIPHEELGGLYHISAEPISKYELLRLVAEHYKRDIEIVPDDGVQVDRSLDSSRFRNLTGYVSPTWPDLVEQMQKNYEQELLYRK